MHGSTCWREWLGTIRTEEVKASNLFLLGKMRAPAASSDDGCPFLSDTLLDLYLPSINQKHASGCHEQVLDVADYIGTTKDRIVQEAVPGGQIGLFIGANTLRDR